MDRSGARGGGEEEEERRRRGGEEERRRRRTRQEEATDIKSNNPHLAGGEKLIFSWLGLILPLIAKDQSTSSYLISQSVDAGYVSLLKY